MVNLWEKIMSFALPHKHLKKWLTWASKRIYNFFQLILAAMVYWAQSIGCVVCFFVQKHLETCLCCKKKLGAETKRSTSWELSNSSFCTLHCCPLTKKTYMKNWSISWSVWYPAPFIPTRPLCDGMCDGRFAKSSKEIHQWNFWCKELLPQNVVRID